MLTDAHPQHPHGNARRNRHLLRGVTAGMNALVFLPVLIPFYRDEIGLGFGDFLIGEAFFAATIILLEVPTGWLSDVWRRKYVLALGGAFGLLGCIFLLLADDLFGAIFAQCVFGIGFSLFSGTNSALLYDSLLAEGRSSDFRRFEGQRQATGMYSVALASLPGGLLYMVDPALPVILTAAGFGVAILCATLMIEPRRHYSAVTRHPLSDMFETLRYAARGHEGIGWLVLVGAGLFCGTKLIMWCQQPYYLSLGIPESWFGILMAGGFGIGGLASHFGHRLDGHVRNVHALGLAIGFAFCVSLWVAWTQNMVGVGLLLITGSGLFGMINPRISSAINKRVGSERRATILSSLGLLTQLFFIPVSLIIGYLDSSGGVSWALYGIGAWLALTGALWTVARSAKGLKTPPEEKISSDLAGL